MTSELRSRRGDGYSDDWDDGYVNQDDGLSPSQDSDDPSVSGDVQDMFRDEENPEVVEMSVTELLYSTSSFYAIVIPVTITMILSALAVVYINNDETLEQGQQQMSQAYQVWKIDEDESMWTNIAMSLANGLIMVTVICLMTFVIVLLYKFECMLFLIGYMMFCSTTLLGFLGGHMWWVAIQIYKLPVDKISYFLGLWNFAAVGVLAVFYGKGVPKTVTQGYLIATSVILAWHLDYFDEYSTWALLFMLALYDLCAVLTPCGPLKALVNLMSRDDAPEMPGLLYEAELPPEARRPGGPRNSARNRTGNNSDQASDALDNRPTTDDSGRITIPLAVARVYNLPVVALSEHSESIMKKRSVSTGDAPLLEENYSDGPHIPDDPNPEQLQADVEVQLPENGGRIEKIRRGGRTMFLEKDRHGTPKRVLWVDRQGRVFAESNDYIDGQDDEEKNTIRLGLGDFIFYSVLVAKAAQHSYTTFAVCSLVILTGLGGTLVLLSVYHHALPALPISIALGIFFYFVTRIIIEPYIEAVMLKPLYV